MDFNRDHIQHLKDFYTETQLRSMGGNLYRGFSCFSPEHGGKDKSKGMKYYPANQWAYCFKCGQGFDLFGMIGIEQGKADFADQYKAACERYGDYPSGQGPGEGWPRKSALQAQKPAGRVNTQTDAPNAPTGISGPLKGISEAEAREQAAEAAKEARERPKGLAVIAEAKRQIKDHPEAYAYLEGRGFSREIVEAAGIGFLKDYAADRKLENRVIFPLRDGYYIARSISEDGRDKYIRPSRKIALFNIELLTSEDNGPVFITEGELDAMTIEYLCGLPAIGFGGSGERRLIEAAQAAREAILANKRALIIIPDNDESGFGQQKAAKLLRELREEGIPALIIGSLTEREAGEKKADVNSNYLKDPDGFRAAIDKAYEKGAAFALDPAAILNEERAAKLEEYKKKTHAATVQEYEAWAIARAAKQSIATDFNGLDALLSGGLREELYFLGAMPSAGKTTFALQIADQVAEAGEDVLFFSLEQGAYELTSKSLSRLTWEEATATERQENLPRASLAVTESFGYKGETEAERKIQGLVRRAVDRYKTFRGMIRIIEAGGISSKQMAEEIRLHKEATGRAPVVFLDYLQIMGIEEKRITDTKARIDQAISDLKRLTREEKLPIIAISSLNREGYEKSGMASLKESGNAEYGADLVLLLGFRNAKDSKEDIDEWIDSESKRNPREMYLRIAKNRNGVRGEKIAFDYYPMYNRFKERPDFVFKKK